MILNIHFSVSTFQKVGSQGSTNTSSSNTLYLFIVVKKESKNYL